MTLRSALLGIASGTAALLALVLFQRQHPAAWALHLAAAALLPMAASGTASGRTLARPSRLTLGLLLLLLLAASGLRLWRVAEIPAAVFNDEANNAFAARGLAERPGTVFVPDTQLPAHAFQLLRFTETVAGPGVLPGRLVSAFWGIAAVLAGFLAGRELSGDRLGLLLAFFLTTARWSLEFSRNGLVIASGLFFTTLAVWLALRALRTEAPRDFVLAGLACGFGTCFYFAGRLAALPVLFVIALFTAGALRRSGWRWTLPRSGGFALAMLLSVSPILQYAILQPQRFFARTDDVSIFRNRDEPSLARALAKNTAVHLLMFHVKGDRNGRHNVPGKPMLDPVTGGLFALGLLAALGRLRQPGWLLVLALFPCGLLGGILTVDWEAPQAARTIAALPAVLALAALGAELLLGGLRRLGGRALAGAVAVPAAGFVAVFNFATYVEAELHHLTVLSDQGLKETQAARRLKEFVGRGAAVFASQELHDHAVIRLIAPPERFPERPLMNPSQLPLREVSPRHEAVILVDEDNLWILEAALRFYPNARTVVDTYPNGVPVLRLLVIPPGDLAAVAGLEARYTPTVRGAVPAAVRAEPEPPGALAAPVPPPYRAEWSGLVDAPRWGRYRWLLDVPGSGEVDLDGRTVARGEGSVSGETVLAAGLHPLVVRAEVRRPGGLSLTCQPPGEAARRISPGLLFRSPPVKSEGLAATLYANASFADPVSDARIDPLIDSYIHIIPLPRPYSVRWKGWLHVPAAGRWELGLRVAGRVRLLLDGTPLLAVDGDDRHVTAPATLAAGRHAVTIEFVDDRERSRLHFSWKPPGGAEAIVPPEALEPEL